MSKNSKVAVNAWQMSVQLNKQANFHLVSGDVVIVAKLDDRSSLSWNKWQIQPFDLAFTAILAFYCLVWWYLSLQ